MYKSLSLLVAILLCGIAPTVPLHGQQLISVSIDATNVKIGAFPAVAVPFTVRDDAGVPVYDLTASNFEVTEDNAPGDRPIASLETIVNPAIRTSVILALDVSGSMEGKPLDDVKTAAAQFLNRLGSEDRVAVLAFGGALDPTGPPDPSRETLFSGDPAAARDLLNSLTAKGITPLYDAVWRATHMASKEPVGNRAVIVLTDGRDETGAGDLGSKVFDARSPIQEANRASIPVFTIGLGEGIDRSYLQRLALETGGTYQETPDSQELTGLFQNVLDLLKQQYVLTYVSGLQGDGKDHRIAVRLDLSGRTDMDEVSFGPLPLTITPEPTATATQVPPTPTQTPTATWTPTPVPPTPTDTVTPTNTPTPTDTATPTGTPTSTPVPTNTPDVGATTLAEARDRETALAATLAARPTSTALVVVIKQPTETPPPTHTPAPTLTPTPVPAGLGGLGMPALLAIIGVVAVVLAAGGAILAAQRRKAQEEAEYCRNCGHQLTEPGDCPYCGDAHRVRKTLR